MKKVKKWKMQFLLAAGLALLALVCCGCTGARGRMISGEDETAEKMTADAPAFTGEAPVQNGKTTAARKMYIHICGWVKHPGLYVFSGKVRAGEAIEKAGGFARGADEAAVNLAQILEDGMQLYIPSAEEQQRCSGEEISGTTPEEKLVNINTAETEELTSLSGIGGAKALAVLSYRKENGSFSSIEDIKNVPGIGEGIFEKIKDYITV